LSGIGQFRRVVTGLGEDGRSRVILDGPIPTTSPQTGLAWRTQAIPADNSGTEDIKERSFTFEMLHDGGSNFMIAEYAPGSRSMLHQTDTVDYIVVLKGEIVLELEAGEASAGPGTFIVDRGVNHAWRNDSGVPAVTAIITLPAKPVGAGRTV
jgi:quercetin dioxygenase-like cupin family protein